jgi:hypothetical protein
VSSHDLLGGRAVRDAMAPAHAAADELRTWVTISRTHPVDIGERHVYVRLDGNPTVKLLFGDTWTVDIPAGAHRLRIHNTLFWRRIPFTVEPGEHLEFIVINSGRWWTYGMAAILGSAPLFLRVLQRSRT